MEGGIPPPPPPGRRRPTKPDLNRVEVLILVFAFLWRTGERSNRLPPTWPGSDSRIRRHMWVEFVVGSLLAPRGFPLGTPISPRMHVHV